MSANSNPDHDHDCQGECPGCPFGGPKVGSKGPIDAPLVIVGESPGVMELREKAPFVGPSGKVLHNLIPEDECYVINAMECFPGGNKDRKKERLPIAAKNCAHRVKELIEAYPRKVIVAVGNAALWSTTGDYGLKITQARGKLFPSPLSEHGVLAAVHPAALMRGTGSYRQFRLDMQYALDLARGGSPHEYTRPDFVEVNDDNIDQIVFDLWGQKEITADIETTGFYPKKGDTILNMGATYDGKTVYVFEDHQIAGIKGLLEDDDIDWAWHNGKFDIAFFREQGIQARVDDDTMLMSYAQDEKPGVHDLETVSGDVLGAPDYKYMVQPYLKSKKSSYADIPRPVLNDYVSIDTGNTHRIRQIYRPRIAADPNMEKLYTRTLIPASEALSQIQDVGFFVDLERVAENEDFYLTQVNGLKDELQQICGYPINPNSPQQVSDLLYSKKKLALPNRGKGSTNEKILKKLPPHPFVKKLLEYREVAKAYSTYVKPVERHMDPDGRIRSTYLIHGTPTGRLASRDPNLQNIPRVPRLRGTYIAAPGKRLVRADFSQAELRSLATLSRDEELCRIYTTEGMSLHVEVALAMFGEGYSKDQYVRAKAVNFGIVYGRTAHTLAEEFQIPLAEGQRMIDAWFERFPGAHDFITKCRLAPARMQNITTCFGRTKHHWLVCRDNLNDLQNEASNFPHQSIASDLTLHAAIEALPKLREIDTQIVNIVHDEIITEAPDNDAIAHQAVQILVETMESIAPKWGLDVVPFKADPETGYRWGSTESYDLNANAQAA